MEFARPPYPRRGLTAAAVSSGLMHLNPVLRHPLGISGKLRYCACFMVFYFYFYFLVFLLGCEWLGGVSRQTIVQVDRCGLNIA